MKKQFTIFLILVFTLGLVPVNFSNAITQNQIDAEVQIVCTDGSDNWFSGSGTIIDPKGIILTNRHVVEGAYMNICFIGFIESISQEPNFGTSGNYNLAEVKYQTVSNDMDAAILYLDNPTNKIYPYINIWDSNSDALQFGDKIEVIGFPSIGGSTITYTSGDFSGFGSVTYGTQNYIKATVFINHGNSGGAAYNSKGEFIGIPTFVIQDITNINYILSVNSIKDWLNTYFGDNYIDIIEKQTPTIQNTPTIQSDITPPDVSNLIESGAILGTGCNLEESIIDFNMYDSQYDTGDSLDRGSGGYSVGVPSEYYHRNNCKNIEQYSSKNNYEENSFSIKIRLSENTGMLYTYLGKNINTIPFKSNESKNVNISTLLTHWVSNDNNTKSWNAPQIIYNSEELPNAGVYYLILQVADENDNYSDRIIIEYNYSPKEVNLNLTPNKYVIYSDDTKQDVLYIVEGKKYVDYIISDDKFFIEWADTIFDENYVYKVQLKEKDKDGIYAENTMGEKYDCRTGNYDIEYCGQSVLKNNTSKKYTLFEHLKEDVIYYFFISSSNNSEENEINPFSIKYDSSYQPNNNNNQINNYDYNLARRLKGNILLQVESSGEAYYVYPENSNRYYLGRPADAFSVMRELGLGATHQFINSYTIYPDHVLGKILIDIEQNGEAYYIYPKDKKAYYLGRPADAFRIMRELGLGITNSDLSKIPEGNL